MLMPAPVPRVGPLTEDGTPCCDSSRDHDVGDADNHRRVAGSAAARPGAATIGASIIARPIAKEFRFSCCVSWVVTSLALGYQHVTSLPAIPAGSHFIHNLSSITTDTFDNRCFCRASIQIHQSLLP